MPGLCAYPPDAATESRGRRASPAPSTPSASAMATPPGSSIPLAFNQEGLWLLDRLQGGSREYHLPLTLALRGPLDRTALHAALQTLVNRHASLRTTFPDSDGVPRQCIAPALALLLPFTDLTAPAPARAGTPEAEFARLRQSVAAAPFDLASGPLLRAHLVRRRPDEHVLLLCFHHLITDGESQAIFLQEFAAAYRARVTGRAADFPTDFPLPPFQYADFAVWQHEWLRSAEHAEQLTYWTRHLAAPTTLELPTDHPRPARMGHEGAQVNFEISASLTTRLAAFARAERVTPFMILLAVYQLLLARHSGQDDILVGTPVANRKLETFDAVIGFFVNSLVLRADLSGEPDFRQLVQRVRNDALDAFEHQDLPFDKLVAALNPPRDPGRHPLFQACFSLHNQGLTPPALPDLESEFLDSEIESAHFDLELTLIARGGRWDAALTYRTDLFLAATITGFATRYLTLLDSALSDPRQPVWRLTLLLAEDQRRLLHAAEPPPVPYPREQNIPELFDAQAARTPQAIALVAGPHTLTYAELDASSTRLAHRLRALGVGPAETPVGVYLDRSPTLVVALLAILKAGGAYVPLAKDHPAARLRFMLADTAAPLVLADAPPPADLAYFGTWLDDLATPATAAAADAAATPAFDLGPLAAERLAYVIYTSGSTGTPKGVAIEHRSVVRLVRGQSYADFRPGDRFLLLAPTAFDASTFELWGPLLNGARCVIAPEGRLDLDTLEALVREADVTCAWLTAGLFNQIADLRPSFFGALRHVLSGGEALSPAHVRRVLDAYPGLRLTNGYGPTECTTFALTHRIDATDTFPAGSVPIGRPIAHTSAYLLDAHLAPVPDGVAGELHLGGDGLARGYLNQPALTAEKFIPHPFSPVPGARLYRTGDRCVRRADGEIEFLGRLDQQVKIRGFRIEPGEIESVLVTLPDVARAVVLVREDTPGEKRLVAYLTATDPAVPPTPTVLRAALVARLPDYLVPVAFVVLPALPLTPNGKTDRRALPAPCASASAADTTGTAGDPRNALERDLAVLWAGALGRPRIGREENFFAAGGHSLLAARISAGLLRHTGRRLPIAVFFTAPTIAAMASWLDAAPDAPVSRALVTLQPRGATPALFCIHGYGGDAYVYLPLAKDLAPDRPLVGVQAIGLDGRRPRHTTVEQMAAHYADEIIAHQPAGPYHLLGFSAGGWMAYAVAQQLRARGASIGLLAVLDTHANALLPFWLHVWESVNQGCKRAVSRWHERDAFIGRLRAVPCRQFVPHVIGRFRHLFGRKTKALPPVAADDIAPPPLRRALRDPHQSPEYYSIAVTRYSAKPYTGDLVIFSSHPDGYFRWSFWPRLVRGRVTIEPAQGAHIDLLEPENTPSLAASLRRLLATAERQGP